MYTERISVQEISGNKQTFAENNICLIEFQENMLFVNKSNN